MRREENEKEVKCKGRIFICLGFYEGDANQMEVRGFGVKRRGGEVSLKGTLGRPWGEGKEMHLMG